MVVMGRVAAPYAVQGWVKVQPFTDYLDSLLDYPVWWLGRAGEWRAHRLLEGRPHTKVLLARLEGIDSREAAEDIQGMEIAVPRGELPPAEEGEYYWDDLIGLEVANTAGASLGRVQGLMETGAHDVLRVRGERETLIPFTAPIVQSVDLAAGRIVVDWEADY
ncbi:MAG: ribosome maturation factor RimM [Thiobacillaceae bacterium]|nr:ribosome maturation factor RimM [Thiobacillaceae bacterium]